MRNRTLWWLHEGNRAIREGQWKLVATKGEPWELYDLSVDRAETNDLSDAHPEIVKRLSISGNNNTHRSKLTRTSTRRREELDRRTKTVQVNR